MGALVLPLVTRREGVVRLRTRPYLWLFLIARHPRLLMPGMKRRSPLRRLLPNLKVKRMPS